MSRSVDVFVGLASKRYGMTVEELAEAAGIGRRSVYTYLRALESVGCKIRRSREAVRGGWVTLYKLVGIRQFSFKIERLAENSRVQQ